MNKEIKTNNTELWRKTSLVLSGVLIIISIAFIFNIYSESQEQKDLKLNQTIQSAYNNGTINGVINLVASMEQTGEFPFTLRNQTNKNQIIGIDTIPLCSQDFYNYLSKICEGK